MTDSAVLGAGDYNSRPRYNASMRACLVFMWAILAASACAPDSSTSARLTLLVYRLEPPAFLELDDAWQPVREIPFALPPGCNLGSIHPAPRGLRLAIELGCAFGPAVIWLDVQTAEVKQPVTNSDSHFLAWAADGKAMLLRIDSINRPRIVRLDLGGNQSPVPITELAYDLAPAPLSDELLFAFSRGMGLGSELWLKRGGGAVVERLATDPGSYLALARWSPDGRHIAFIKIPDSPTPFTTGELWVMEADGTQPRRLASADAGHGFAPAWSPDGTRIAFVSRDNVDDASADTSSAALDSSIHLVRLEGGEAARIADPVGARVEAPVWKPDAEVLLFGASLDDRMAVYVVDLIAGSIQPIPIESICCAAWLRE